MLIKQNICTTNRTLNFTLLLIFLRCFDNICSALAKIFINSPKIIVVIKCTKHQVSAKLSPKCVEGTCIYIYLSIYRYVCWVCCATLISWLTGKVFAAAVAVTLVIMKVGQLGHSSGREREREQQRWGCRGPLGIRANNVEGVRLRLQVCTSITKLDSGLCIVAGN